MDGYHFYRKDLDAEGVRRRGADFTIDLGRMLKDLTYLKATRKGSFPAFAHETKDPIENAITVDSTFNLFIY
jgi:pantothenate kinase